MIREIVREERLSLQVRGLTSVERTAIQKRILSSHKIAVSF